MTRCQNSASRGTKSWQGLSVGAMVIDVDAPLLVLRTYVMRTYARTLSCLAIRATAASAARAADLRSDDSTYVRSPRCPKVINQVGGQRPTYVCTYVRTYVAAHVRVVRAGLMLRIEIDTCVRENVRT